MGKNHKNVCTGLNYIEQLLIFASAITWIVSVSAFSLVVGIPVGIACFIVGLKICTMIAVMKAYKSIAKKMKRKKKFVLLTKTKLNTV